MMLLMVASVMMMMMMMALVVNARPHQPTSDAALPLPSSAAQPSLQTHPGPGGMAELMNEHDTVLSTAVHDSVAERSTQLTRQSSVCLPKPLCNVWYR